jgi:hypothetical protein
VTLPEISALKITVKGVSVWSCWGCGTAAFGDSVTLEFQSLEPSSVGVELQERIKRLNPAAMPVGWASWGNGRVTCGNCTPNVRYRDGDYELE